MKNLPDDAADGHAAAEIAGLRREIHRLEAETAELRSLLQVHAQNEAELERLFSFSLEMLCIAGMDGFFKRLNLAFEQTLGYPLAELMARPLLDFVHPDDQGRTQAEIDKLSRGIPTVRFVNRYRRKDGEYRRLQWTAIPRTEEGLIYATATDVTDQLRREEWLQAAVEFAPDAIIISDHHGKIVLVNDQAQKIFGYDGEELLGQLIEILVPERLRESHAVHRERFARSPSVRGMGSRPDLPVRRKDGTEFLAEISLGPMRTESDSFTFTVIRDVTERRRVEAALRDNEAQSLGAQRIQKHFLPRAAPSIPGYDIAGVSCPAEFTGGDYFDYIPMGGATTAIVIADVSGHGFGPALLTVALRNHLRSLIAHHDKLEEILGDANQLLCGEMELEYFITVLMGQLDPRAGTFRYLNAGHPSGFLLDGEGRVKALLKSRGLPLGILPELEFPAAQSVALAPGDLLLLLTDGVLEAHSTTAGEFGEERTLQLVRTLRDRPAAQIVEALCGEVRAFSENQKILDDVTAVVIKVAATTEPV
jgi:sigma-B regulation protein RsbU (phosphoserine phosphatase)